MRDLASWTQRGHPITVSVNVSVRNLHSHVLPHVLDEALRRHGVEPGSVGLEITEGAAMDDFEHCVKLIGDLRDLGFSVSIDDFGTGHSSLACLKQLPVTMLKIDQAFIRHLATDTRDQRITRAIIDLASALDLESVAEGVRDQTSTDLLRDWGCDATTCRATSCTRRARSRSSSRGSNVTASIGADPIQPLPLSGSCLLYTSPSPRD